MQSVIFSRLERRLNEPEPREKKMLFAFAEASCKTSNPDVLWQIAAHESGFRPMVSLDNKTKTIANGDQTLTFVELAQADPSKVNVDVGILQINIRSHGFEFGKLGLSILNPQDQVQYVIEGMMPQLTKRCGEKWVGCYHSWKNGSRAVKYSAAIDRQRLALRRALSRTAGIELPIKDRNIK